MKHEATATEAVWQERVAAWRASGETAERFARGRGFAATTLRWWSSRLGRTTAAPEFVRLVPRAAAPAVAPAVVVEVGGARIHVAPGFDAALLAQVVAALRGPTP